MITEALDAYAKTLERQFSHDRKATVGASEIGQCARKVHWRKRGGPTNPNHTERWGAHLRGTIIEQHLWAPAMKEKFGANLRYAGADQKTIERPPLSATPDALVVSSDQEALRHLGIANTEGDSFLVECKTIDPRANLFKEREVNHFQVQVQLGLIREATDHKPTYAVISYVDASFWDEVTEFAVKFDEGIYESAKQRAAMILSADSAADLKPEGYIAGGGECEWCPFSDACGIARRSVPTGDTRPDPQFVAEIADLCRDVQDAKVQIDVLEAESREGQQEIKDRMRTKGIRKIPGVVTWSAVKGRDSYDMEGLRAAAEAAGVDLQKFCTEGDPTDRLQISVGPRAG